MCDWNDFEFNEPYDGKEISSVLGVPLPAQYIEFMKNTMVERATLAESAG